MNMKHRTNELNIVLAKYISYQNGTVKEVLGNYCITGHEPLHKLSNQPRKLKIPNILELSLTLPALTGVLYSIFH